MLDPDVIAPNLNRRQSGVSATVFALVPLQNQHVSIVATGVGLPQDLPQISLWRIPFLPRRTRVWHARRNNEMLVGLIFKSILRMKLKLVFTSSSPRKRGKLTQWLLSKMDMIVATNEINASVMPGAPTIIAHGVDTQIFTPGPSDLFAADGQKIVGCFGRVRPMKGTHHFVDAMCALLPDHPSFSAIVMGRVAQKYEGYASDLRAKIDNAGLSDRILFEGEQPIGNMPAAYRSLSIYAAPSLLEGFGLTPLEAMACGVPTVASRDVGAFNQQVVEGQTGFLVTKDDTQTLQDALQILMSDSEKLTQFSAAAQEHVRANFSLDRESNALVSLYKKLINT